MNFLFCNLAARQKLKEQIQREKEKDGRNRVCAMHLLTSSALAYSLALYFLVSLSSIIVIYEMRRPFEERKKKL